VLVYATERFMKNHAVFIQVVDEISVFSVIFACSKFFETQIHGTIFQSGSFTTQT
jgi:hypothetical protein